ncbi:uncharacterized protein YfdQ (DUF2303 family) [Pseudorhizobium tarimense]|uniref:Uncharacterized protein YfdQ (DUF2303 family) n=1 Tax=Pseudorhizobium tarimense TaxID=1079109 RepID=A0ABV2H237_9HYPH|nr:DUF2303 family protein [Pseudorhizobium tarimense]MCJ8517790.1 YfdQ family protein [Pseudorhizobium tarimense]
MDQLSETAVNAIAELTRDAGVTVQNITPPNIPGLPSSVPVIIDPKSGSAKSVKSLVEEWRETPDRKRGTAKVHTLESFIHLVDRHKTEDSVIFADIDWQKPSLTAIIDYHEKGNGGEADNGKHRIYYPFPLSEEWKEWVRFNGQPMKQGEFAEFIEDRIAELATPHEEEVADWQDKLGGKVAYPNEIVMLSRGLKVNAETKVVNHVTLSSGEAQITFEEEHRDQNGQKLVVPSLFIIKLPPFFRGEAVRVPVRLRYRVQAGSLIWFYQLYRPDVYITEEVELSLQRAAAATELPAFQGTPEMSA